MLNVHLLFPWNIHDGTKRSNEGKEKEYGFQVKSSLNGLALFLLLVTNRCKNLVNLSHCLFFCFFVHSWLYSLNLTICMMWTIFNLFFEAWAPFYSVVTRALLLDFHSKWNYTQNLKCWSDLLILAFKASAFSNIAIWTIFMVSLSLYFPGILIWFNL